MYVTLTDIAALLGTAIEDHELDFKHGGELDGLDEPARQSDVKKSIAKDASAFANAGGGTIIYGIDEAKQGGESVASQIAPVKSSKVTVDRLTQIIQQGTEPPLSKFIVRAISDSAGVIFVVDVERADTAHQCKQDHKYYRRVGATNCPMHDSEIRDVMNRRTSPKIVLTIGYNKTAGSNGDVTMKLIPRLQNMGALTAANWALEIFIPERVAHLMENHAFLVMEKARDRTLAAHRKFEFNSAREPIKTPLRLLPGQEFNLDTSMGFPVLAARFRQDDWSALNEEKPSIIARLYVDNCPMVEHAEAFESWFKP